MVESKKFKNDVKRSVEAGVRPIELEFFPVVDFDDGTPIAYRSELVIHSAIKGEMREKYYTRVIDDKDCGTELFEYAVTRLAQALNTFRTRGKDVKFVSVRCPSELVEKIDFYQTLKRLVGKQSKETRSRMCIEFPPSVLDKNRDKAITAILDVKAVGLKTAIRNCGKDDFAVTKLAEITPDIVYTDPSVSAWAGDRNKPRLFTSFTAFLGCLGIEVIAEAEEKYRKKMRGADCGGFISANCEPISFETILNRSGGVE